jgi:hypothetical protein
MSRASRLHRAHYAECGQYLSVYAVTAVGKV